MFSMFCVLICYVMPGCFALSRFSVTSLTLSTLKGSKAQVIIIHKSSIILQFLTLQNAQPVGLQLPVHFRALSGRHIEQHTEHLHIEKHLFSLFLCFSFSLFFVCVHGCIFALSVGGFSQVACQVHHPRLGPSLFGHPPPEWGHRLLVCPNPLSPVQHH